MRVDYKTRMKEGTMKLIPTIIEEAKKKCVEIPEAQIECLQVLKRLTLLTNIIVKSTTTITDNILNEGIELIDRFRDLLKIMTAEHSLVKEFAGRKSILLRKVLEFHSDIDRLIPKLGLHEDEATRVFHEWHESIEAARFALKVALQSLCIGIPSAMTAANDERTRLEIWTILLYECQRQCGQYPREWKDVMNALGTCYSRATTPSVPEWFIARHDIFFEETPALRGSLGELYRATYLGESVTVMLVEVKAGNQQRAYVEAVASWYKLSHPSVVRLIGACHIDEKFVVFEGVEYDSLLTYLRPRENRLFTWQKLYELASGTEYLYDRSMLDSGLVYDNVVVGKDGKAKLFPASYLADLTTNQSASAVRANKAPPVSSVLHSLGLFIVKASALNMPLRILQQSSLNDEEFPSKPQHMNDDLWLLVRDMCSLDPGSTTELSFVVQKLHQFALKERDYLKSSSMTLMEAVEGNQVDFASFLVEHGDAIDEKDSDGEMPLHRAATYGQLPMLKTLARYGAAIDALNDAGCTPLLLAVEHNRFEAAEYFLMSRAAVDLADANGRSPLAVAAEMNHEDIARILINHGARIDGVETPVRLVGDFDPYISDSGSSDYEPEYFVNTPLCAAISNHHVDVAKCLVQAGASLGLQNEDGEIPIFVAVRHGCIDIIKFLVDRGSMIDQRDDDGQTLLHQGVRFGKLVIVKELVRLGASIDVENEYGLTPIAEAVRRDEIKIVEFLAESGAVITQKSASGKTLLHRAKSLDMAKALVERDAGLDEKDAKKQTPLHIASKNGYADIAEYLLLNHASVHTKDINDQTPLFLAVRNGSKETIKVLLKSDAFIDEIDTDGQTCLHIASLLKDVDVVTFLLKNGASVGWKDTRGQIPLLFAAQFGKLDIVKALIQFGSPIDEADVEGRTPLLRATKYDNVDVALYLMDNRASVHVADKKDRTPLILGADTSDVEFLKALISKGASVHQKDARGETPLLLAAASGNLENMKLLLQSGSDIDEADVEGHTPLLAAFMSRNTDCARYLLDHGASIKHADKGGLTPLFYAIQFCRPEMVRDIITKGADVNSRNASGQTALIFAIMYDSPEIVELLIDNGADIQAKDEQDRDPLYYAAEGSSSIVSILIKRGVQIHETYDNGRTATFAAVESENANVLKQLLQAGLAVDTKDGRRSRTALHIAAKRGHKKCVMTLLEFRATVDMLDKDWRTPLYLAVKAGWSEIMELLIDSRASVNMRDVNGRTPIFELLTSGRLNDLENIISRGASFEIKDSDNRSPILVATMAGELEVVRFLIKKEATVNGKDVCNRTLAHYAAEKGNVDLLDLLCSKCPIDERDSDFRTPLFRAAKQGHVSALSTLIRHGASIHNQDMDGRTALHDAAENGHIDATRYLLEAGARPDAKDSSGRTAIWNAAVKGHVGVVDLLVQRDSSLEEVDRCGRTVLFAAIEANSSESVRFLLEHGVNTAARDISMWSPLLLASKLGRAEIAACLIDKNSALIEERFKDGRTPLFFAVTNGHRDILSHLIQEGAIVDLRDENGNTPLHAAVYANQLTSVEMLLAISADVNLANCCNETPLLSAARLGHFEILKLLLEHGANVNVQSSDGETALLSAARFGYMRILPLLVNSRDATQSIIPRKDAPLLLCTLKAIQNASESAFEFREMCEHIVKRLVEICNHIQVSETKCFDRECGLIFAKIVFRFCKMFLKCREIATPLSRSIARRAILNSMQDIHEEIDRFTQLYCPSWSENLQSEWMEQWSCDVANQKTKFREMLINSTLKPSTIVGQETEVTLLLQHELRALGVKDERGEKELIQKLIDSHATHGDHHVPSLPDWFVSRDDVEFEDWDRLQGEDYLFISKYRGRWLKSTVMISTSQAALSDFEHLTNNWFGLNHPHVLRLFGACHIGTPRFFMYNYCAHGTLREYLNAGDNRRFMWQRLYEAGLGLQYLHDQKVFHGELCCENLLVGTDLTTRIAGFGESSIRFDSNSRHWEPPEFRLGGRISRESDIYVFGMCILETAIADTCSPVEQDVYFNAVSKQWTPSLPATLTLDHWKLIKAMCGPDPSRRAPMSNVVMRLEWFASSAARQFSLDLRSAAGVWEGISEGNRLQQLQNIYAQKLEQVNRKAYRGPNRTTVSQVLPRLTDLHAILQSMKKSSDDSEITSFCEILDAFDHYCLRTPVTQASIAAAARSRKLTEKSNLFHVKLDQLIERLNLKEIDRTVHMWEPIGEIQEEEEDAKHGDIESKTGILSSTTNVSDHLQSRSVILTVFDCDKDSVWHNPSKLKPAYGWLSGQNWYLRFNDVTFRDQVAEGSFGTVHLGTWKNTVVIIKRMGYEGDKESVSTSLFLHEVRIWYQLKHPHVIELFGACHDGKRFFVCEYASNGTLIDFLKRDGQQNKSFMWEKLQEAALGLSYFHGKGFAHNDLKCDNILIGAGGRAKLSDFGLSSIPNVVEVMIDVKHIGATHWRSPEYLAGGRLTFASDIYSFAMCILEAVTGEAPWGIQMVPSVVRFRVKRGNIPKQPDGMTPAQWNLIKLMTIQDPKKRVNITYVVEQLTEFAQESQPL